MSSKVEKGKDISVLVEQAFPTCILVSFQHGDKTFRGVLLDESCQTSVIRATPSDVQGKTDNPANLGLTTSRATTCQSDLHHLPSGGVSTRSSSMMLRDSREGRTERITPVHKIRGLVERLTQRPRKLAPKPQPSSTSHPEKGETLKEVEIAHTALQKSSNENRKGNRNVKRKRADQTDASSLKAAKTTYASDNSDTLGPPKNDDQTVAMNQSNLSSSPMCGKSPLFPILKLRKTSSLDNSYVAVTMFNSVETKLKAEQNGTDKLESMATGSTTEKPSTSQDATHHKHNTRFKAGKAGPQKHPKQVQPEVKIIQTCNSGAMKMKEQIPNVLTEKNVVTKPQSYCNPTTKAILPSHTKRQLNKRMIHHSMNIGDIAWGKVHGHPWWPCRVLGIICSGYKLDESHQIVNVSWYGSPTTSDISCKLLLTFKEHFKHLYKKQKKGAYQLAVKQAQHDLDLSFSAGTQVIPA